MRAKGEYWAGTSRMSLLCTLSSVVACLNRPPRRLCHVVVTSISPRYFRHQWFLVADHCVHHYIEYGGWQWVPLRHASISSEGFSIVPPLPRYHLNSLPIILEELEGPVPHFISPQDTQAPGPVQCVATVYNAFGNASGYIVESSIKYRESTIFFHPEYSLDRPGPSIAVSGPHEEFFSGAFGIWIGEKYFSDGCCRPISIHKVPRHLDLSNASPQCITLLEMQVDTLWRVQSNIENQQYFSTQNIHWIGQGRRLQFQDHMKNFSVVLSVYG